MSLLRIEAVQRALMQAPACGDQFDYWQHASGWTLCLVDGLGHGELAQIAALAALDYVRAHLEEPLEALFKGCDLALRGTRGVAMSVARIDAEGSLECAGIGNTQVRIWRRNPADKSIRLSGNYGIVGGGYRSLKPERLQLEPDDLLILHSDGISDRFDLKEIEHDLLEDPGLLAAHLLSNWGRSLDDAAVMVALYRIAPESQPPVLPGSQA